MAAPDLAQIPDVDIDPDGVFKYVLIRVHAAPAGQSKEIVRGYKWAEYHGEGGAGPRRRWAGPRRRWAGPSSRGARPRASWEGIPRGVWGPGAPGLRWPDPSLLFPAPLPSLGGPSPGESAARSWGSDPRVPRAPG